VSGTLRRSVAAAFILALACARPAFAITASPDVFVFTQPDGARLSVHMIGDEHGHLFEDLAGYVVMQAENGEYRYAVRSADGDLIAGAIRAGGGNPAAAGLQPHLRQTGAARAQRFALIGQQNRPTVITPASGTVKNLVILAQFADHGAALIKPATDFDKLLNNIGGDPTVAPTGSVRDVWRENSYNKLDLVSTVLPWTILPSNESWYAANASGFNSGRRDSMVTDALNQLDATVNFAQYDQNNDGYVDAIDLIHSGYGSEATANKQNVWSQQWTLATDWVSQDRNANNVLVKVSRIHTEAALFGNGGANMCRIGVVAHETGHFFGLPDLYDYDYDGMGAGYWCLMGDSWGWDGSQQYPPQLSAWCKQRLNFTTPGIISGPSSYTLPQAETTQAMFKITAGFPANEYLLIENREPVGFDQQIPQGGLAIWHIDEEQLTNPLHAVNQLQGFPGQPGWPANNAHYGIALLQADGHYDLEKLAWAGNAHGDAGDLYRASGVHILNESTVPSTDSYTHGDYPTGIDIRPASDAAAIMTVAVRPGSWVDLLAAGSELGTFLAPFHSVAAAVAGTPAEGGIVFKPGTSHELPLLNKSLMYRSWNGSMVIGR
jgi:M6 family metalloprotease-like protein